MNCKDCIHYDVCEWTYDIESRAKIEKDKDCEYFYFHNNEDLFGRCTKFNIPFLNFDLLDAIKHYCSFVELEKALKER